MERKALMPPKSWKNQNTHYLKAVESDWYRLLVDLEDLITTETYNFYKLKGMKTMHLPITTGSISSPIGRGSDSSPVKIKIDGVETYLADSMQFMLEYGCRLTSNGCYYIMPSFRGEKADSRHLCQFYHSEAEIPGKLDDVMNLVEEYIKFLTSKILENYGEVLEDNLFDISHLKILTSKGYSFKKITFDDAEKFLKRKHPKTINQYVEYHNGWRDITKKAEKELVSEYGIVWVCKYDDLTVPFYQAIDSDGKAFNADLLMGIGEVVGCGQRHMDYTQVIKSLNRHGVNKNQYKWYLEMKKHYPLQTSGFGMGTERFLMWVLDGTDIRDFQICVRFNGRKIIQ